MSICAKEKELKKTDETNASGNRFLEKKADQKVARPPSITALSPPQGTWDCLL
jgi:hypothetical protein